MFNDPLAFLNLVGGQVMGSVGAPNPDMQAARLAQLADPLAFATLFPNAQLITDTTGETDPLLMTQPAYNKTTPPFLGALPGVPQNAPGSGNVSPPQPPADDVRPGGPAPIEDRNPPKQPTKLTSEQMMKLMSLMNPPAESMRMPQAPAPQPGRFTGNMAQLQTAAPAAAMRPTLAQLLYGIYGRR